MARKSSKAMSKVKPKRVAKRTSSQESWGSQIASRLKRFAESLESLPPGAALESRFTVRTVKLNVPPPACSPQEVKATREVLGTSQAIFAQFLGVSSSAVQDWEQGHKPPRGSACRLMHEIRRDPAYWRRRLVELVESSKS
jgi:putative transcriptional regulator